jgi:hypothetical protein
LILILWIGKWIGSREEVQIVQQIKIIILLINQMIVGIVLIVEDRTGRDGGNHALHIIILVFGVKWI